MTSFYRGRGNQGIKISQYKDLMYNDQLSACGGWE